jgi:hypothetical protein
VQSWWLCDVAKAFSMRAHEFRLLDSIKKNTQKNKQKHKNKIIVKSRVCPNI